MGLQDAFVEFGRLLDERLSLGVLTTEDTIRYTLYVALTTTGGLKHTDLIMEYPHPTIDAAKVDTVIAAATDRQSVALEFKYDRANPGGTNQNRTQRAGKALVDLFRLVKVPAEVANAKYFVYVTDPEMAGYFRNPKNRLNDLFELAEGVEHSLGWESFLEYALTLRQAIEQHVTMCVVSRVFAADLSNGHCVRIFQVSAPPSGKPALAQHPSG